MFTFVIALFILLVSSLPWVAIFSVSNKKPAWLMALYLVGSANVTLSTYIANSLYLLDQQWVMLTLHLCFGGVGWLAWARAGKPSLSRPFEGWKIKFNAEWLRREPVLALLMLNVAAFYVFALIQIIFVPQNN